MDIVCIITLIGVIIAAVATIHQFLRNFKNDIEKRIDKLEDRMDALDERMFWALTGKRLEDAILEEKMKRQKQTS